MPIFCATVPAGAVVALRPCHRLAVRQLAYNSDGFVTCWPQSPSPTTIAIVEVALVGMLMGQRRIVLFALIAAFLAFLALPINFAWRTPAVAASNGHCMPAGATCIALNPEVTAETIGSTICASGYTRHLRPDAGYVSDMKIKIGHEASLASDAAAVMILDHIIPLELGGHPRDVSNLQLQDAAESHLKDNVEKWLHDVVCAGLASLDDARAAIVKDWRTAEQQFEIRVTSIRGD